MNSNLNLDTSNNTFLCHTSQPKNHLNKSSIVIENDSQLNKSHQSVQSIESSNDLPKSSNDNKKVTEKHKPISKTLVVKRAQTDLISRQESTVNSNTRSKQISKSQDYYSIFIKFSLLFKP